MIWLSEGLLILIWVSMAYWHFQLIKNERPIKHGWWAALSGAMIAAATAWTWPLLHGWNHVSYALAQGCSRAVVFNVCLNLFRGDPWNHTSTTTTSIIDQLEYRLFGQRAWIVEIVLAVIFLFINFLVL